MKRFQVFTEKDADGFYHGELNGRVGLVPSNLVVEAPTQEGQYLMQRPEQSPSYSETPPEYPTYSKRLPQPSTFMHHPADLRNHPPPDSYYHRRPYIPSDLERWGNSSDPSLTRTRPIEYDYESQPTTAMIDRDQRYVQGHQQQMDPRHRRSKFKHQSRSLDYDLDREEYTDRDRMGYDNGKYPTARSARDGRGYGLPAKSSDTSRGRSMDRYERDVYQPEYDEYTTQR